MQRISLEEVREAYAALPHVKPVQGGWGLPRTDGPTEVLDRLETCCPLVALVAARYGEREAIDIIDPPRDDDDTAEDDDLSVRQEVAGLLGVPVLYVMGFQMGVDAHVFNFPSVEGMLGYQDGIAVRRAMFDTQPG